MFEWVYATGGCLATNGCLLWLWSDNLLLGARVNHMEVIINRHENETNNIDVSLSSKIDNLEKIIKKQEAEHKKAIKQISDLDERIYEIERNK